MYSLLHRVISRRLYETFEPYRKQDPSLSELPIASDFVKFDLPGFNLFSFNFKRTKSSRDLGYIGKFELFNYKMVREYYMKTFDSTQLLNRDSNYDIIMDVINNNNDSYENVSPIEKDHLRFVRNTFIERMTGSGVVQRFSQETLDMIYYTLIFATYPEHFMRTPLQVFSYDISALMTFVNSIVPRKADVIRKDSAPMKLFNRTADSMYSKFYNKGNYKYDTRKYFNMYVYAHAIFRYHLVNLLLLTYNDALFGNADNVWFVYEPFRQLMLKNLINKYKELIPQVILKKNLDYNEIPLLILTDVIDYLQMFGLYLSWINKYPEEIDYLNAKPGEEVDHVDINLKRYYSQIVNLHDVDEFMSEVLTRVSEIEHDPLDTNKLKQFEFLYGNIFNTSRYLGFHALFTQTNLPNDDLYFQELTIPRQYLGKIFESFELNILYGLNWYYFDYFEDQKRVLTENYINNFPFANGKYYATHPFITPTGLKMIETLKNVGMRYHKVFEKYPDLEKTLEGRMEYVRFDAKLKWNMDMSQNTDFIPHGFSNFVTPYITKHIDCITNAKYTIDKYRKDPNINKICENVEEVQYRREKIKVIPYDENLIVTPYDVDILTYRASGYIESSKEELERKREEYIKEHYNKEQNNKEEDSKISISEKSSSIIKNEESIRNNIENETTTNNEEVLDNDKEDIAEVIVECREETEVNEQENIDEEVNEEDVEHDNNFKQDDKISVVTKVEKVERTIQQDETELKSTVVNVIEKENSNEENSSNNTNIGVFEKLMNKMLEKMDIIIDKLDRTNKVLEKLVDKVENSSSNISGIKEQLEKNSEELNEIKSILTDSFTNITTNDSQKSNTTNNDEEDRNIIVENVRMKKLVVTNETNKHVLIRDCLIDEMIITDREDNTENKNKNVDDIRQNNVVRKDNKKQDTQNIVEENKSEKHISSVNHNTTKQEKEQIPKDIGKNSSITDDSIKDNSLEEHCIEDELFSDLSEGLKRTNEIIKESEQEISDSGGLDDPTKLPF